MTHNERLMHLVLDNEASADEERELLLLVASDPQARGQYELFRAQRLQATDVVLESERQLRALMGMAEDGMTLVPCESRLATRA